MEIVVSLANAIKSNRTLKGLCLSRSHLNADMISYLTDALKQNSTLERLELRENNLGSAGLGHVFEYMRVAPALKAIMLGHITFTENDVFLLAEELKINDTLEELNLDVCGIDGNGVRFIADALKLNRTLRRLDLAWNPLGSTGAGYLAKALESNHTLQVFDLHATNFQGEGACLFADVLAKNHGLKILYLRNNPLGYPDLGCIRRLAESLKVNRALQVLQLNDIGLSQEGVGYFFDALKINNNLLTLYIYDNPTGSISSKDLSAALKKNYSLLELYIEGLECGDNPFLIRNRALVPCLSPLQQGLDFSKVSECLMRLKTLVSIEEIRCLPETHLLRESLVILQGLRHFFHGESDIAILKLSKNFSTTQYQQLAERVIAAALMLALPQFYDAPPDEQQALYLWLAYAARDDLDSTEFYTGWEGLQSQKLIQEDAPVPSVNNLESFFQENNLVDARELVIQRLSLNRVISQIKTFIQKQLHDTDGFLYMVNRKEKKILASLITKINKPDSNVTPISSLLNQAETTCSQRKTKQFLKTLNDKYGSILLLQKTTELAPNHMHAGLQI